MIDIKQFKNNPNNPRTIKKDQLEKLKRSIQSFPEMMSKRPMVCVTDTDGKMYPLGGNMRLRAIKELGLKEIPSEWFVLADEWTEEQRKEFVIKDNASLGDWDFSALVDGWNVGDLEEWGVDVPAKWNVEETVEDNFDIEPKTETDIVLGDLFEIGEHRLLCGDSTDADFIEKLMNGNKAEMIFTDPPYLMNFEGSVNRDGGKSYNATRGKIKNDKMSREDGDLFLDKINLNIKSFVEGAFYITFYRLGIGKYFHSLERTQMNVRSLIIWDKGHHTLSNSDFMSKYEPIFYGWVKNHNFYGGKNKRDVWNINRTQKNTLHPTMKPLELIAEAINNSSRIGDTVLDLFLGSGSTMLASHQLNRKCYGMELDPHYCDVIIRRMLTFDKGLKIKRNGNDEADLWLNKINNNND